MTSRKHWSNRSEAARDEVKDAFEETADWLIVHRREAAWTCFAVAVAAVIAGLILHGRQSRANAAWDNLAQAELDSYSGRLPQAQERLDQIIETASPLTASLAYLLKGDLLYPRGEYGQALTAYDKAAQDAPATLKPYALADKVLGLEAAGKFADCAATAQSFLDANPDHVLAAEVYKSLARCQLAQGQKDAAKSTLQRIGLLYANTSWAAWAGARLQNLPQ